MIAGSPGLMAGFLLSIGYAVTKMRKGEKEEESQE